MAATGIVGRALHAGTRRRSATWLVVALVAALLAPPAAAAQGLTDALSHPPPTSGSFPYSPPGTWIPGSAGVLAPGQAFVDPIFGTTIRRLTNDFPGQSFSSIYVANGWWNADGTYWFHNRQSGGVVIDSSTGIIVRSNAPQSSEHVISFDPLNPDVYYFFSGASLKSYSVSAGVSTTLKTFPATLQSLGASVDFVDRAGRYFLVSYSGALHVWDKQTDTIFTGSIAFTLTTGWAGISPDGLYVITAQGTTFTSYAVDPAGQTLSSAGTVFWTLCGDHADIMSASDGKTYVAAFNCSDENSVYRIDVTLPQTPGNVAQQKSQNKKLLTLDPNDAAHISCVALGANQDWCFVSVESIDDLFTNQGAWRAYKQEIVMIQAMSPFTVRRLAHHRSRDTDANYYFQPRVSASWDGTKAAWASNFGFDASPTGYSDIYFVQIPGNNPAPSVTSLTPSSMPAGSSSFTLTVNGTGFISSSLVQWNGANRSTTFVSGTQLRTTIAAADVALAGTASVRVFTPAPGGGTSSALTFTITPDTTAPTVAVTAPVAGAVVMGTVTVTATASDDVGVAGVQFTLDGANLGAEDTVSPYSISWDTRTVANGAHLLAAVARDAAGNTATAAAVSVTVMNPVLTVTPAGTTDFTSVALGATADRSFTVTNGGGGTLSGTANTSAPFSIVSGGSFTLTANASATVVVRFRPTAPGPASGTLSFASTAGGASRGLAGTGVDATLPTVSLTAPAAGAMVAGTVNLTATATDNVGVVGVQFQIDGVAFGAEVTTAPYTIAWDTTAVADGAHTVGAVARDAAANTKTATVTVNVGNNALVVTPTPSVDFGSVVVGATSDHTLSVMNTGPGTVTGSATATAPFTVVSGGAFTLGHGVSSSVVVRFAPKAKGHATGTVTFSSNGGHPSRDLGGDGTPPLRTLTITKRGTGSGHVTSASPAFDCGTVCSAKVTEGTSVTLQATASAGSVFTGWSGACGGTNSSCTLTVDADKTATAEFTLLSVVAFSAPAYTVSEAGKTATITVTRTGGTHAGVSVDMMTSDGTAHAGTDYTAVATTLTFAAGQTSVTVAVPVADDTIVDGSRTVNLALANLQGLAVLGAQTAAVLSITDNDVAGTFQLSAAAYSVAEPAGTAAPVVVRVTRSGGLASNVMVTLATADGTAQAGLDYVAVSQTLTFGAGETFKDVPITILPDSLVEGDETFTVALSSPTSGAKLGIASATITILDAQVGLQFSAPVFRASENGGSATITVVRSGPTTGITTVAYATADGTAVAGTDYTATSGVLTFMPGVRIRTFTVPLRDNTVVDGVRTALLELGAVTNGALGPQHTAVLTINDNDAGGALAFSAPAYSIGERAGTATITVLRTGGMASAVTVGYATSDGTATAGTDYTATSGTLTFAANQASQTFTVPILDDSRVDGSRTINLTLSNPTGGSRLGPLAGAVLTIVDDDLGGTLRLSAAAYRVSEGGLATVTVMRSGGAAGGVTVSYATSDQTALAGVDYTAASGTLTFGPGDTIKTFTVQTAAIAGAERNRTFAVSLSAPGGGAVLGTPVSGSVTIEDTTTSLEFSAATYPVGEARGSVVVTVLRSGPLTGTSTASYATSDGSAVAGSDYTASSGTLTFTPGVATRTVSIAIRNNVLVDGNRSIVLALSNPVGAVLGAQNTAQVTIVDDDGPGTLQFSAATARVVEGGTATLTVVRTAGIGGTVTVPYTVGGGTATSGTDYVATSGTLTFAPGASSRTLTVRTLDNTVVDGDRTVVVSLGTPTGGATLGTPGSLVLTIADNDAGGVLQFSAGAYKVTEGGLATITVQRASGAASAVTVQYAASAGTASPGVDFAPVSGTLTFGAGQMSQTFTVQTIGDTTAQGDRTVALALSSPAGGAVLGATVTATLTVVDDEPRLRFSQGAYRVTEGATATITVLRTGPTTGTVSVSYAVGFGNASAADVQGPLSGTLTFGPGVTSRTFTVATVDDTLAEGDETLTLTLSGPVGASLDSPSTATLTITDNDVAGTVQWSSAAYSAPQTSGVVLVTIARTGGAASGVTVDYATQDGSAAAGTNYVATSGTVTFAAGEKAKTIVVPILTAGTLPAPETFTLTLSNPTGHAALGTPSSTQVFILDH